VNNSASLGRGLGRSITIATLAGMLIFATIVTIVIYIAELGEERSRLRRPSGSRCRCCSAESSRMAPPIVSTR